MLVELANDTCVKFSMEPQDYKVVNIHAQEISGWKFLSRLIHGNTPNTGGMNYDVQSDLPTLELNNR